ncbi:DUF2752 domain-containing protein (plasmid) [Streptomyces sp. BI20]|uniref:DUF2752 domain-containing protein n=1 Tax=Streptomyces sp. BI20 TaxID=3403460 RepID=UPI003C7728B9
MADPAPERPHRPLRPSAPPEAGRAPRRHRIALAALTVLAAAGLWYTARHDPGAPGTLFPPCPWHAVTGLDCPACGGTRMVRALLYGDLDAAARANPALLAVSPLALAACLRLLWTTGVRGRPWRPPLGPRGPALVLTLAVGWTVLRNLR